MTMTQVSNSGPNGHSCLLSVLHVSVRMLVELWARNTETQSIQLGIETEIYKMIVLVEH